MTKEELMRQAIELSTEMSLTVAAHLVPSLPKMEKS